MILDNKKIKDEQIPYVKDKVRSLLIESVKKHPADGILFSGGLDTSILAGLDKNMTAHLGRLTTALTELVTKLRPVKGEKEA